MPRVAFIGAGSGVFAETLIGDILSWEALADCDLALMDVDADRLEVTGTAAESMAAAADVPATVTTTTDRRVALRDADYVISAINVGGLEPFENEIRIPEQYGVDQAIGDTLGPGGIFRGLRTVPTLVDIAQDMAEVCPEAPLLNYTNPMAICCRAVDRATDVDIFGLCHSVQHTAMAIAIYTDVPYEELEYEVAGINHLAWFLRCEHEGQSVYPALREAMTDDETYRRDTVRFELLNHFGYFVTESSHHASEYLPYFRTDPETIESMTGEWWAERMPTGSYLEEWRDRPARDPAAMAAALEAEPPEIERSEEYASRVIHAMETGESRTLNLNVPNDGAIRNLPDGACVEVPCLVDGTGVHPCTVGRLPAQLAALCRSNVDVQELAVEAALHGDRQALHHAVKLDPLTAAACTLEEAHEMTEELLSANSAFLQTFE